LATIIRKKLPDDAAAMATLVRERTIGALIVGLPKNMDGSEGGTAQAARAFMRNLTQTWQATRAVPDSDLPVLFWDERLSSAAVERFLISDDMSRGRRDQVIDKAAAAYILQGVLDALHFARNVSAPT
jgi:putative Holliday junction resolvase